MDTCARLPTPTLPRKGGGRKQTAEPDTRPVLGRVETTGAIERRLYPVIEREQLSICPVANRIPSPHGQAPGRRIDRGHAIEKPLGHGQLRRLQRAVLVRPGEAPG